MERPEKQGPIAWPYEITWWQGSTEHLLRAEESTEAETVTNALLARAEVDRVRVVRIVDDRMRPNGEGALEALKSRMPVYGPREGDRG